MNDKLYHYRAVVQAVYDGDTCTVDIDLGLGMWVHGEKLRLYRINAPERRGKEKEAGLKSAAYLRNLINGKQIYVQTIKDRKEKFGRYLADIWLEGENNTWLNVNDLMVQQGYAAYKEY
jgi:micrococcal nuclease